MAASTSANGDAIPLGLKSKSAVAREYIEAHPDAANKAVFEALSATVPGLKISDVTNARSSLKKAGTGKRRRKGRRRKSTPATGNGASAARKPRANAEALLAACGQAVELVHTAGGIDEAIVLLQTLKSIRGS